MRDIIPYVNPTDILKFFNEFPLKQFEKAKPQVGQSVVVTSASIVDYFITIPTKFREQGPYVMEYHNALLKMCQLLVNEGLLTPEGNASGMEQRYHGNGFGKPQLIDYGYYDFMIYGFPVIRKNFEDAVRPVIVNHNVKDKKEDIGSGFTIGHNRTMYFVTARHCLPKGELITIPMFLPQGEPLMPVNIFGAQDPNVDLVIIETSDKVAISDKCFFLDKPQVLDNVLTMGYPPIQGFTEAIQVSETATIATDLKSSTGQITGSGKHYWGGMKDHFLISARVKGGNSGGPVINRYGLVVGVVIELLQNETTPDLLGYGVAISSTVIEDLLTSIDGKEHKMDFEKLAFEKNEFGFWLT